MRSPAARAVAGTVQPRQAAVIAPNARLDEAVVEIALDLGDDVIALTRRQAEAGEDGGVARIARLAVEQAQTRLPAAAGPPFVRDAERGDGEDRRMRLRIVGADAGRGVEEQAAGRLHVEQAVEIDQAEGGDVAAVAGRAPQPRLEQARPRNRVDIGDGLRVARIARAEAAMRVDQHIAEGFPAGRGAPVGGQVEIVHAHAADAQAALRIGGEIGGQGRADMHGLRGGVDEAAKRREAAEQGDP